MAMADTSHNYVNVLAEAYGVVDKPAHSPDLNPCNFYLWGTLKIKGCVNSPHSL
jgi:hypothetical protein